jgi:outer membrane protein assembly factor BamE (lipoprotein component of BamABCDE complex)
MKHSSILYAICISALAFSGCAHVHGKKVDSAAVTQIQKGVTTKAELIAKLGEPNSTTQRGDGGEMLMWRYTESQTNAATYVPIVGMFAGGRSTSATVLTVMVGADGNSIMRFDIG